MSRRTLTKMIEVDANVEEWTCDQCRAIADIRIDDKFPHPMPDGWISVSQYKGDPFVDDRVHFDTFSCASTWCAGKVPTTNATR